MPAEVEPEGLHRLLKEFWGYDQFRALQLQAVQATLAKKDVLLILPTGGGKSVAFQLPPLAKANAVTIVICPLIALAKAGLALASPDKAPGPKDPR